VHADVDVFAEFGRTNPMFVNEINVEMKSRDIVDGCPEAGLVLNRPASLGCWTERVSGDLRG
jgi:hypothetical protein